MTGQREAADRQSEYMREGLIATGKAAEAAEKSANAALTALNYTQDALVLLEGIKRINNLDEPGTVLTAVLKNHGSIAATNATITIAAAVNSKVVHNKVTTMPATIGPNGLTTISTDPVATFIANDIIEAVKTGTAVLAVIVRVVFAGAKGQVTKHFAATYQHASRRFTKTELPSDLITKMTQALAHKSTGQEGYGQPENQS